MRRISLSALFFILFLATGISYSQVTSGNIAGTVKDATGAVIAHAHIVATNEDTKVSYTDDASGAGDFHIGNIPGGTYDVIASASGFSTFSLKGLHVDLNKTSTANLTLSVSANQNVEVSAEAGVTLDTTTTNLTQTFENQELSELPTATVGLGVINVSLLSPGVASSGGVGIGVGPSIGGQRPRNNNFTVEGIDNNNKSVTGPLVYIPNDAVGSFTLITNQFSPEFGHSSGGQFNTNVVSGTNHFHGRVYEYFQNRNLNAASGPAGGKIANPRFDNNRYGGEIGGPILRDKLFFFFNYERNTIGGGAGLSYFLCTPTASGLATLNSLAGPNGFSANNLQQYLKYTPAANVTGQNGGAISDSADVACFNNPDSTGAQHLVVTGPGGSQTQIPLGNYQVKGNAFTNLDVVTSAVDYTISSTDSIRGRFIYNTQSATDTTAFLPVFFTQNPEKFYLFALSEYHTFTPNLVNEFRVGFNRFDSITSAGNFSFPGLDQFPNLTFFDQGGINLGPDSNAPQSTIQNLYQVTENISYTHGKHLFKFGFDGRKYISPQSFTQRARGDYEWGTLDEYLHDLAPDNANGGFAQRSTGNQTYYGDQTALYGYGNDTWRVTPSVTLNVGLRYEFTSVPVGERTQSLNSAASVPGLISFNAPQPTYTSFAPRVGVNWAPDSKTSVRAGFGIAQDVLFDNLGTLSFPPQYSATQSVGTGSAPAFGAPNFLANGGLPPGTGSGITTFPTPAAARAATSAFVPNQVTPYAETYTLTIQRTVGSGLTAEVGYVGTRGIHLPTQDQINIQPKATTANQLSTTVNGSTVLVPAGGNNTLADIIGLSNILPQYLSNGFASAITSYQPYSSSNYNGLVANLQGRLHNGLQMNLSYTYSKNLDDATAEVFSTVLTPRRPQNSQNVAADYSRSALDHTHRISLEAVYDVPFYKHSGFVLRNLVGNWVIAPIYTYESPEYATALSGVNSNLNGDSGTAIDRPNINPNGVKGTGTGVVPVLNAVACDPNAASGDPTAITGSGLLGGTIAPSCPVNTVGYSAGSISTSADGLTSTFTPSNAYYVQAGPGTAPTASRNSLPIRPINNIDLTAVKRLTVRDHYSLEFGAQGFNVLNHAQYIPGSIDNVSGPGYTNTYNFQTVTSSAFGQANKVFNNNARTMQLYLKFAF